MPGGGAGLPLVGSAGLPAMGGPGLPAMGGPGLPAMGGPGLPMPGGPGLPSAGGAGLPSAGGPGLPMAGGPGLPGMSHAGLPVVGNAGLPVMSGAGLPTTGGPGGPGSPFDMGFAGSGAGLPMPPQDGAGTEASFGSEAFGSGIELGGGPPGGVGGELDLDAPAGLGKGAPLPHRERRSTESDAPPAPRGRWIKFVAGGMLLLAVGGVVLTAVPSIGFFGKNYFSDKVNAEANDASLIELRKSAQVDLDDDTLSQANAAMQKATAAHTERERHKDTSAYTAYIIYARSIRFGRSGGDESTAKTLLDSTERKGDTTSSRLALAAEDVLGGQLARARQTVQQVLAESPEDVDAMVLAGEIELVAKEPAAAIEAFSKAASAHKSARTLFGLARAQLAAGKQAEADATAKSVLELSKNHVAARTLLATIAAGSASRETEALSLLQQITKDEAVRGSASPSELVEAYIQLGRVQLIASRVTQAQEAFGEALKLDPQAVAALVGSGELFYRSGRFSEAEARFDAALRTDADNVEAKLGMAKTWISLERQREAKDMLEKLKAAHPEEPRVYFWQARVEELLGKRKDAEGLYEESIKRAKTPETSVPAYVALAHLLASSSRVEDAAKKLTEAAQKWPDSAELSRARGEVALQTGHFEEALTQFEAALKKTPDDLQTRFSLGVTLRKMRKFDEANAVFEMVAKVDKDYPGLALERGLYYEETGQNDQALAIFGEALQKAPNDVDLKLRIGSTQVVAGHAKLAEPILKEVVRERPNSAEANHFYGRALLLSGSNLNEAMRHLKRAVDLDPNQAEYHLYIGWAANEAGQPAVAEASLAKALELDASLGDAYWQRGVLYQKQGRSVDAIKDLMIALERRPSLYQAHSTLALAFEDQNDIRRAEEEYRKAIAGNDKIADWHYRLGRLLDRKRADQESVAELDKAVELAGDRDPRPGWLANAHLLLGAAYRTSDKEKAIFHYSEYLRLSAPEDAYRRDAETALAQLKGQ